MGGISGIILSIVEKNNRIAKEWKTYYFALEYFEQYQDMVLKQEEEERAKSKSSLNSYTNLNILTCPRCGSVNTIKISTINRAVSVRLFGLASKTIGKQYQCINCNHLW